MTTWLNGSLCDSDWDDNKPCLWDSVTMSTCHVTSRSSSVTSQPAAAAAAAGRCGRPEPVNRRARVGGEGRSIARCHGGYDRDLQRPTATGRRSIAVHWAESQPSRCQHWSNSRHLQRARFTNDLDGSFRNTSIAANILIVAYLCNSL